MPQRRSRFPESSTLNVLLLVVLIVLLSVLLYRGMRYLWALISSEAGGSSLLPPPASSDPPEAERDHGNHDDEEHREQDDRVEIDGRHWRVPQQVREAGRGHDDTLGRGMIVVTRGVYRKPGNIG